jgi:putative transposase
VVAERGGYGHGEGAFEQADAGPNPTDRAKKGTKRSLLVDGRGVPTAVVIAAANVPDFLLLGDTFGAQQLEPPAAPQAPARVVCLDRGYHQKAVIELCQIFHVTPSVEARHEEAARLAADPVQRAKRWVVERAFSWLNRFRRLLIRWEKKPENYLSFLHLSCAIITYRHTPLPG